MPMKLLNILLAFSLIIVINSCRTAEVTVLEDDNRNFRLTNYSTFDFVETTAEGMFTEYQQLHINNIKDEITQQMNARGLRRDEENPDLKVNIGISVEERAQTRETNLVTDPGTFTYVGQRRYAWRSETIEVGRYREGTGTIHLIDTEDNRAVWVGVVEKILPAREGRIEGAVRFGVREAFDKIDEYN